MALLWGAGCRQTKLLGKTTGGNSDPEISGLIEEKNLENRKKEEGTKRETEKLEQKVEKEIREKIGPNRKAKAEERTDPRDSFSLQSSKIVYGQIFSFFSFYFCCCFSFLNRLALAFRSSFSVSIMLYW